MGLWRYSSTICNLGSWWRWVVIFMSLLLYPWETATGTHCIGGWMGSRAGLYVMDSRKVFWLYQELNLNSVVIQPSHYTDWAVPAPPLFYGIWFNTSLQGSANVIIMQQHTPSDSYPWNLLKIANFSSSCSISLQCVLFIITLLSR
jgi:hypothetical protein